MSLFLCGRAEADWPRNLQGHFPMSHCSIGQLVSRSKQIQASVTLPVLQPPGATSANVICISSPVPSSHTAASCPEEAMGKLIPLLAQHWLVVPHQPYRLACSRAICTSQTTTEQDTNENGLYLCDWVSA